MKRAQAASQTHDVATNLERLGRVTTQLTALGLYKWTQVRRVCPPTPLPAPSGYAMLTACTECPNPSLVMAPLARTGERPGLHPPAGRGENQVCIGRGNEGPSDSERRLAMGRRACHLQGPRPTWHPQLTARECGPKTQRPGREGRGVQVSSCTYGTSQRSPHTVCARVLCCCVQVALLFACHSEAHAASRHAFARAVVSGICIPQAVVAGAVRDATRTISVALKRALDRFAADRRGTGSQTQRRPLTSAEREELNLHLEPLRQLQEALLHSRQACEVHQRAGPAAVLRALGVTGTGGKDSEPQAGPSLASVLEGMSAGVW